MVNRHSYGSITNFLVETHRTRNSVSPTKYGTAFGVVIKNRISAVEPASGFRQQRKEAYASSVEHCFVTWRVVFSSIRCKATFMLWKRRKPKWRWRQCITLNNKVRPTPILPYTQDSMWIKRSTSKVVWVSQRYLPNFCSYLSVEQTRNSVWPPMHFVNNLFSWQLKRFSG